MNTAIDNSPLYEEIGKLVFESGLPQILGLYPDHPLHDGAESQEAAAMLLGMLKTISAGDYFDGQDLQQWKDDSFKLTSLISD